MKKVEQKELEVKDGRKQKQPDLLDLYKPKRSRMDRASEHWRAMCLAKPLNHVYPIPWNQTPAKKGVLPISIQTTDSRI